jgi:hypothetical protein
MPPRTPLNLFFVALFVVMVASAVAVPLSLASVLSRPVGYAAALVLIGSVAFFAGDIVGLVRGYSHGLNKMNQADMEEDKDQSDTEESEKSFDLQMLDKLKLGDKADTPETAAARHGMKDPRAFMAMICEAKQAQLKGKSAYAEVLHKYAKPRTTMNSLIKKWGALCVDEAPSQPDEASSSG